MHGYDRRSAPETLKVRLDTTRKFLAQIERELARIERIGGKSPDWGYAGSVGGVNTTLSELVQSLQTIR